MPRPAFFPLLLVVLLLIAVSFGALPSSSQLCFPTPLGGAVNVIGQPDFVSNAFSDLANGLSSPNDVTIDPVSRKIFVSDMFNNRVLRYSSTSAFTNFAPAEAVIGLATIPPQCHPREMSAPRQLDFFGGSLFIADSGNSRVLRFDGAAFSPNHPSASAVFGQPDGFTCSPGQTLFKLSFPFGIVVDANGTLWTADSANYRVMSLFNAVTQTSGPLFNGIVGVSGTPGITDHQFSGPRSLAVDLHSGTLFVVDAGANRIMAFRSLFLRDTSPAAVPVRADFVLGQPDLNPNPERIVNQGCSASMFFSPGGITIDQTSSTLFVSDSVNNRVLFFFNAVSLTNGAAANGVIGQPDLNTCPLDAYYPPTQSNFRLPRGLHFDSSTPGFFLMVADSGANRVLRLQCPNPPSYTASNTFTPSNTASNTATQSSTVSPTMSVTNSATSNPTVSQSLTATPPESSSPSSSNTPSQTSSLSDKASPSTSRSLGASGSVSPIPSSQSNSVGALPSTSSSPARGSATATPNPQRSSTTTPDPVASSPIDQPSSSAARPSRSASAAAAGTSSAAARPSSPAARPSPSAAAHSSSPRPAPPSPVPPPSKKPSRSRPAPPPPAPEPSRSSNAVIIRQPGVAVIEIPDDIKRDDVSVRRVPNREIEKDDVKGPDGSGRAQLLSGVIEINVKDHVALPRPVKLCFRVDKDKIPDGKAPSSSKPTSGCSKETVPAACLSFLKKDGSESGGKFECVDRKLNVSSTSSGQAEACGFTPHLSTFAVLLGSSSVEVCAEESDYLWPSVGVILGVLLLVCLFFLVEWRFQLVRRLVLGEEGYSVDEFRRQVKESKKEAKEEAKKKPSLKRGISIFTKENAHGMDEVAEMDNV